MNSFRELIAIIALIIVVVAACGYTNQEYGATIDTILDEWLDGK